MSSPFDATNAKASEPLCTPDNAHRHSVHRAKARRQMNEQEPGRPRLDPGHKLAFYWVREDAERSIGLLPCTVNGEDSAIIMTAEIDHDARQVRMIPLFVAITPGMRIVGPEGELFHEPQDRPGEGA